MAFSDFFQYQLCPTFQFTSQEKADSTIWWTEEAAEFFIVTKKFSFYLQSMQTLSLYCPYIDAMLPWKILKYLIKKNFSSPPPVVARKEG